MATEGNFIRGIRSTCPSCLASLNPRAGTTTECPSCHIGLPSGSLDIQKGRGRQVRMNRSRGGPNRVTGVSPVEGEVIRNERTTLEP